MRNLLVSLGAIGALAVSGAVAAQTNWNMATPYPESEFHTKNIRLFAEDVAEKTDGQLTITVHSGQSLIRHPEIPRAVRTGQVQLGEIMMANLVNEDPIFAADNLPFLISGYDDAKELWQAQRPFVVERLEDMNLKLLYAVPWPPQGFYTKNPVDSVSDLEGTNFRTYNSLTAKMARLMGAVPTTIEAVEIPQAFATGVVDAMVTSAATGVRTKAWDFANHYYDIQAWMPKNMVFVNKRAFDSLSDQQKEQVLEAAREAEARGWKMSEEEFHATTKELAGYMPVEKPSEKFREQVVEIGEKMASDWADEAGPDGKAILRALE